MSAEPASVKERTIMRPTLFLHILGIALIGLLCAEWGYRRVVGLA